MTQFVSKSRFKSQALGLFHQVERPGMPVIITDRGIPVLQLTLYRDDPNAALMALRKA